MYFDIRHYSGYILSCPNIDRVICNSFLFMYRDLLIRTRQRNVAMKVLHELVFHVDREQGFLSRNQFHILCSRWYIIGYTILCRYQIRIRNRRAQFIHFLNIYTVSSISRDSFRNFDRKKPPFLIYEKCIPRKIYSS